MQQFRVEFFINAIDDKGEHYLWNAHHDFIDTPHIDDDYLALQATAFDIRPTENVTTGQIARIVRDDTTYFVGMVTNVAPTDYTTKVTVSPLISIFDGPILFDTAYQGQNKEQFSLENVLAYYIIENYVDNEDVLQNYPIDIVLPEAGKHTLKWEMDVGIDFLREDGDGSQKTVINFYETLIVNALKVYGVTIKPVINFATGRITLTVGKTSGRRIIDADLENIKVLAMKVNDRPNGTNKLVVYNSDNYAQRATFYVHPDRTWDIQNVDRILPVATNIVTVTPDSSVEDPDEAFAVAALDAAMDNLSGLEWDDYIELQCAPNDAIVNPMTLNPGQLVTIYYKGNVYSSILTGRTVQRDTVSLIFGSERIKLTKKRY